MRECATLRRECRSTRRSCPRDTGDVSHASRSGRGAASLSLVLVGCNVVFGVDELSFDPYGSAGAATGVGGQGGASVAMASSSAAGGAGGAAGGLATSASTGGAGGAADTIGCADGTRELFASAQVLDIAGCSGAWSVPGLVDAATLLPQCARQAGNDGAIPNGGGCSVADLCAAKWHVCVDKAEVAAKAPNGACSNNGVLAGIWIVRTGAPAQATSCAMTGPNNLFGCGAGIGQGAPNDCAPLTRVLLKSHCDNSGSWECGGQLYEDMEVTIVTKLDSSQGGVLCCTDP